MSKKTASLIILLIFIVFIPILLYASSKRQEIRGKAAPVQNYIYQTPEITNITPTQALIKYVTTVKTTTFVAYDNTNSSFQGAVNNMGRWRIEDNTQTASIHSHQLTGLTPNTTYYFIVSGYNPLTNSYVSPSQISSFTTLSITKDCTITDLNKDGKTDLKDAGLMQSCLNTKIEGACANMDIKPDSKIDGLDMDLITNCL